MTAASVFRMTFEKLFRSLSYAAVFCGFLSLWVSGTFGVIGTALFVGVMVVAWFLEGWRWQISERVGTVLIVAALPAYYGLWKIGFFSFADSGSMVAGILGRLILTLSAIKILQRKSDRDWIFLYLMAFFEVLLAAGLSISATYLLSFILFVFVMVCTVIVFEVRKTSGQVAAKFASDKAIATDQPAPLPARRLPAAAVILIFFIISTSLPLFFLLPRVGGAGLGSSTAGISTSSGFSDTVSLGGFGNIQQNDQIVMRVRLEGENVNTAGLKWRGVALDTFDNKSWSRTKAAAKEPRVRTDRDIIQVDYASGRENLTVQTIYLEPLDAPVIFALPRAVGVQGNFPVLFRDKHGAITFNRVGERISYKVLSDRTLPSAAQLRIDRAPVPDEFGNYLQLPPDLDPRIISLAANIAGDTTNRYDAARAVEGHLQNAYGYTLEQKASGAQPLADFLFNVREGHCEYFATAMAIMLRTRGIPTRVVNGFSQGEYNDTADVWLVKQKNAHSWVEVYFPSENVWVPFDPTPFSGQVAAGATNGIMAQVGKYLEALETFWIQYFVAFDNQEQRSLFTSFRRGFADYQAKASSWTNRIGDRITEWWQDVRGDRGIETGVAAAGRGLAVLALTAIGVVLLVLAYRRIVKLRVWAGLWNRLLGRRSASVVAFYERMVEILSEKGLSREPSQTPLEFAYSLGSPDVIRITEMYNAVRFGNAKLTDDDVGEVEASLESMKSHK